MLIFYSLPGYVNDRILSLQCYSNKDVQILLIHLICFFNRDLYSVRGNTYCSSNICINRAWTRAYIYANEICSSIMIVHYLIKSIFEAVVATLIVRGESDNKVILKLMRRWGMFVFQSTCVWEVNTSYYMMITKSGAQSLLLIA
ncbi:unnamed protein product [Albugo candida]|uniref:Uncharacterized protein n=1 Tax=Albugo candida TaxID=65357 RepID=A0A024GVI3_9STRA|nr:unnamed protein product [Albugo candida]|eukprot:CCI50636.1 unnamed protein product [Albugo candida]